MNNRLRPGPWRLPRGSTPAQRIEFLSIPEPNSGCLLWLGTVSDSGYGRLKIGSQTPQPAHRVAWEIANGPVPAGMHVCHKCDVPACVNPRHLFLGTHDDNMADKKRKGRCGHPGDRRGALNPGAKLTESDVRAILVDDRIQSAIAEAYGVRPSTIAMIKAGRTWRHISGDQLAEAKRRLP